MPIYKVTATAGKAEQVRLVKAKTAPQALAFATEEHIKVERASDDDLIALTKQNVEVENAGD